MDKSQWSDCGPVPLGPREVPLKVGDMIRGFDGAMGEVTHIQGNAVSWVERPSFGRIEFHRVSSRPFVYPVGCARPPKT